ncbi:hypothetical protein ACFSTC_53950 [Nonomuraea ferruginea]
MAARHSATASGAPSSLARSRPRYGEALIKAVLMLAALVSIATTIGIVVSLLEPTLRFFTEVSALEFFTSTNWGAAVRASHLWRTAPGERDAHHDGDRGGGGRAARAGRRHLPVRVRQAARQEVLQARARGAG